MSDAHFNPTIMVLEDVVWRLIQVDVASAGDCKARRVDWQEWCLSRARLHEEFAWKEGNLPDVTLNALAVCRAFEDLAKELDL